MGAQWKHSIRQVNAAKKGAMMGKLVKEIIVSAKIGGADLDGNFRLRTAVEAARKNSVPRDTIERSIKRGAGLLDDGLQFETITYEGFAPHQVPVIVECLTDNRNRTAADIRVLFRKGQIGAAGSVAWMFDRKGVIEAHNQHSDIDIEGVAIEAGADDVKKIEPTEDQPKTGILASFTCSTSDLDAVTRALEAQGWKTLTSEFQYIAKSTTTLDASQMKEVEEFLTEIDDHDDVHRIYTSL